jgi:ribosomal protein S18 acetylase RimI-like enzyme
MEIEPVRSEDAEPLAEIFTSARRAAMPWLPEHHSEEEDRAFIRERVMSECEVLVARREGRLVGFLALKDELVDHLYVAPADQRQGIGSALLEVAKARRPDGLRLWVFQRNTGAIDFYIRRGFTEVMRTDGSDNEQGEPDVLLSASAAGATAVPSN